MGSYFGTYALSAGEKITIDVGAGGLQGVIIGNESGFTVIVSFDGTGLSRSLYPGTVDFFPIPSQRFNGNLILTPIANLSNVSSWPGAYVQIDTVGVNEQVTGVYPFALVRNTNVGNAVSTVNGGAQYIQNDGNPSGISIVESTVSGDSASSVEILNDGVMTLGQGTLRQGSLSVNDTSGSANATVINGGQGTFPKGVVANLISAQSANDIGLHVGPSNNIIDTVNGVNIFEVNSGGAQLLSGTLTVGTGVYIIANLIVAQASNDLGFHVGSGNYVVNTVNGVNIFQVGSGGPQLLSGTLSLLTGSISRISKFSGGSTNGKVTVNHGLGVVPDLVLVTFNLSSTPVAATIGPNYATLTSTTVDIWASVAANFVGVAIKF
jgi:hypothetical protein